MEGTSFLSYFHRGWNKLLILIVKRVERVEELEHELNDIELIEKMRTGDDGAFTILVERYRLVVAKTVVGMLGHIAEADDVGQEVFIRFYKSRNEFRGESTLATYLTRIAINLSLNEIKRKKRHDSFFFYRDKDEPSKQTDVPDSEDHEARYESNELIEAALDDLDERSRSIVVLRLIQGYSSKETASMLGLPIGTVLSRLSRAQDKMKLTLTKLMRQKTTT